MNLGTQDVFSAPFMNYVKTFFSDNVLVNGNDPSKRDNNGFPNTTLSANYGGAFYLSNAIAGNSTDFVVQVVGSPSSRIKFTINVNVTLQGACTNLMSSGGSGSALTITSAGGTGTCTFRFVDYASNQVSFYFNSGYANVGGITDIAVVKLSDLTAYNSDDCQLRYKCFTPQFLTLMSNLGMQNVRTMGWNNTNDSNEVNYNYRATPSSLMFAPSGAFYSGKTYAGGTSSTASDHQCAGTLALTAMNATDSPADWTDGEVLQCVMENTVANDSATLTIGSRVTSKSIACWDNTAQSNCSLAGGSLVTFVYNSILDKVLVRRGGITIGVPIEYQVALANLLNVNLWYTFPAWAQNGYFTSTASYVSSNLRSNLMFIPEYSNEIWNNASGFGQTNWARGMGQALGFPSANDEDLHGWYALRVRQINGILMPSVFGSQMATRVRRPLMFQAAGATVNVSTYRLQGADLAPSGVSTGKGNSVYCTYTGGVWSGSCTGGANYTTPGNRPIDYTDIVGYAPYAGGANYCTGGDLVCTPTSANVPFYNQVIAAWNPSDPSAAIALVDADITSGRTLVNNVTASGTTFTTVDGGGSPVAHGFTAGSTRALFGGVLYSGLTANALYLVASTPTSSTFTIQAYTNGVAGGSAVNAGSAGAGTMTVGRSPQHQSMSYHANVTYPLWQSVLSGLSYAGRIDQYEGNLEPAGPTPAQCSSLGLTTASTYTFTGTLVNGSGTVRNILTADFAGIQQGMTISGADISGTINSGGTTFGPQTGTLASSSAATASATETISITGSANNACSILNQALTAWKNSATARTTTIAYFKQFVGTDPASPTYGALGLSRYPGWLVFPGPTEYGMTPGGFYTTPYKTYNGFADFRIN